MATSKERAVFWLRFQNDQLRENGPEDGQAKTGWPLSPSGRQELERLKQYGYGSSPVECHRKSTSGEQMTLPVPGNHITRFRCLHLPMNKGRDSCKTMCQLIEKTLMLVPRKRHMVEPDKAWCPGPKGIPEHHSSEPRETSPSRFLGEKNYSRHRRL